MNRFGSLLGRAALHSPILPRHRVVYVTNRWISLTGSAIKRDASFNVSHIHRRQLFISTEATPNEHALKFIPSGVRVMAEGGVREFLKADQAAGSPLARALFDVAGVSSVFFGPDFISVNKAPDVEWKHIKPSIYARIMDHFASGQPLFTAPSTSSSGLDGDAPRSTRGSTEIQPDDPEVVQMIKELLDTRIRPAVQGDGGDIEYRGFVDGVVRLRLQGSCRSCASATLTLKHGIENMMCHYIPEVKAVEQVLDETEQVSERVFDQLEHAQTKKQS